MKIDLFEYHFDERLFEVGEKEIVRVVYTQPRHEGRLYEFCRQEDIACYLPLRKIWKPMTQRHGSKVYHYPKVVLRPMFSSYMFIKMSPEQRQALFATGSMLRVLGDIDQNQTKLLDEIRLVHQIENIAQNEEIEFNAEIKEGTKFLIESGPWQGVYGGLKKRRSRFVWSVEIECVNMVVQATLDPSQVKMSPAE